MMTPECWISDSKLMITLILPHGDVHGYVVKLYPSPHVPAHLKYLVKETFTPDPLAAMYQLDGMTKKLGGTWTLVSAPR